MIDTAARIGIAIHRYEVITVLAAPLVCSNFQHDFDIVSSPVFTYLGISTKQDREAMAARITSAFATRPILKLSWDIVAMVFSYYILCLIRLSKVIAFAGCSITR